MLPYVTHTVTVCNNVTRCYTIYPGTKKWDTCAGEAIIKALGGKMTDVFGKPIQYGADASYPNKTGVLAAMRDFDFYVSKIPANIMDR